MEIEAEEYVRTKRGIAKILEVKTVKTKMYGKHDVAYLIDKCPRMYITETEFIKHRKNIIDLIEEGDFVNGYPVKRIANFNNELCNFDLNTMEWTPLKDIDVYYNILTKEQYMQNCYKLVDRPADS